jgi:hypothetical protein
MLKEYSQEEIWKLYEKLPPDLKEAIFSEETGENIWQIGERYGIEDEKISLIARLTGRVLIGLLPPTEFQEVLEKDLSLEEEVAKKVSHEIYRFVFAPVKDSLAEVYGKKIPRPEEVTLPSKEEKEVEIAPSEIEKEKEEIYRWLRPEEKPKKGDIYREPIE